MNMSAIVPVRKTLDRRGPHSLGGRSRKRWDRGRRRVGSEDRRRKPAQAGKDLFARLRKAAKGPPNRPIWTPPNAARQLGGRTGPRPAMLSPAPRPAREGAPRRRAGSAGTGYDLAITRHKAGSVPAAKATLATVNAGRSVGRSPEVIAAPCVGLVKNGCRPTTAEIAWRRGDGRGDCRGPRKNAYAVRPRRGPGRRGEPAGAAEIDEGILSRCPPGQRPTGRVGQDRRGAGPPGGREVRGAGQGPHLAHTAVWLLTKLRKQSEKTRGRQAERCHVFADEFAAAAKTVIQEKEKAAAKQERRRRTEQQSAEFLEWRNRWRSREASSCRFPFVEVAGRAHWSSPWRCASGRRARACPPIPRAARESVWMFIVPMQHVR